MSDTDPYWVYKQSGTAKSCRYRVTLGPSSPVVTGCSNGPNGAFYFINTPDALNTGLIAEVRLTSVGTNGPTAAPLVVDIIALPAAAVAPVTLGGPSAFDTAPTGWRSVFAGNRAAMPTLAPGHFSSVTSSIPIPGLMAGDILATNVIACDGSTQSIEVQILIFYEE